MSRFHEEQHFHDALMGLLVLAMIFIVGVTVLAVVLSRPNDALLLATAPVVVVLVAALISLSHLDVDVTDSGVSIDQDPDDSDRRPEQRFAAISRLTGCY